MLCDKCKKNVATVHYTQIVNNKVTKIHLCEECSAEIKKDSKSIEVLFAIPQFLAGLLDMESAESDAFDDLMSDTKSCPKCKTTINDIKETGKFGCSQCYEAFADKIELLIKKIHSGQQHLGKVPTKVAEKVKIKVKIEEMRNDLKKHVEKEEYEQAAELRDNIRKLESKLSKKSK